MNYDIDGIKISKTVTGVKTTYQYVGDKLFYENRGNGDSFYYFYDSYGKLSAIYHHRNGTKVAYHVLTNSQGDVIALYSWAGALVATYEYDAWGNCTIVSDTSSTGIATLNPMRYRGYYYDKDLGLYYLQSRYYDFEIGRFINADSFVTTGQGVMSYNMYSYCQNNPVMFSDPSGHFLVGLAFCVVGFAIGAALVGAIALAVNTIAEHSQNEANEKQINTEIQKSYSKDEAKTEIDNILSNYGNSNITFNDDGAEISNSYLVDSKYDRQKISMIISRTDTLTNREYDNISAEWNYHNVMYSLDFKGGWYKDIKGSATHAKLDYLDDPRTIKVAIPTKIFEALGWD